MLWWLRFRLRSGNPAVRRGIIRRLLAILAYEDSTLREKAIRLIRTVEPTMAVEEVLFAASNPAKLLAAIWVEPAVAAEQVLLTLRKTSSGVGRSTPMILQCYSILEEIFHIALPEHDIKRIVEVIASDLRAKASRTTGPYEGYWSPNGGSSLAVYRERYIGIIPSPDEDGIRRVISLIPNSLRSRVFDLSGTAQKYFENSEP
jgi:hypothetical protein